MITILLAPMCVLLWLHLNFKIILTSIHKEQENLYSTMQTIKYNLKWKVSNQRRNVLSNEKYENCPCNEIIFSKKKLVHVKNFKKIVSNLRVAHWIAPRPTPTKSNHHIHVHGHWSHCFGIANARNHIHSQHNVANGSRLVLVNLSIDTSLKKSNIILRYKDCGYGSEWVF